MRARGTHKPPRPRSEAFKSPSPWPSPRRRRPPSRQAGRGIRRGRAPHRAEADPAAGLAPKGERAPDRPRPPPPRVALRHRLRLTRHRRDPPSGTSPTGYPSRSSRLALLALFAREAGAGRDRTIVLALDDAGWRTEPGLAVPDGISSSTPPPYPPELQPAERLWPTSTSRPPTAASPTSSRSTPPSPAADASPSTPTRTWSYEPELAPTGGRNPSRRTDHPEIKDPTSLRVAGPNINACRPITRPFRCDSGERAEREAGASPSKSV